MGGQPDWFLLAFFTSAAFIFITFVLLVTKLVEDHLKPPLAEIIFDLFGSLFYFTSGCLSFSYYSTFKTAARFQAAGFAFGTIALITSGLYLTDAILPYKDKMPSVTTIRTVATKSLRA